MQFLPIVERELRVAARQRKTWWRRMLTTAVALVIFTLFFVSMSQVMGPSYVGRDLFGVLGSLGFVYALFGGPVTTADCLNRERREGTLGLLFLTDLHSYDVVLGKVAAASLNVVLDLTAALPVVAIPLLMGGVSLAQLGIVALALVNILFLSLAIGTCASALVRSSRSSLVLTLAVLFFLTIGTVFLGEQVLEIRNGGPAAPWFYMLCPFYTMVCCLGKMYTVPRWDYWLNMGAMHVLGWGFLLAAVWRTATAWRDLPASARQLWWRERFARWRQGGAAARRAWRLAMLDRNPVSWLEGRDRLQERLLRAILLAVAIGGVIMHLHAPLRWPNEDWVVFWAVLAHYALCVWIAIQAPRRLADDRESGALELLLCTPIQPAAIVRGSMRVLRRRFGRGLLALMLLDAFFVAAYVNGHGGGWSGFRRSDLSELALCGLMVFPVQAYSLARIGLYQGLVQANSLRATFMAIWKAGVLPWALFISFMIAWETARHHFWSLPNPTGHSVCATWIGAHLLPCALFLAHASWRLHREFRALAAEPARAAWWKRWLRMNRRPLLASR